MLVKQMFGSVVSYFFLEGRRSVADPCLGFQGRPRRDAPTSVSRTLPFVQIEIRASNLNKRTEVAALIGLLIRADELLQLLPVRIVRLLL